VIELKGRLKAIADFVPQGSVVIDVGTDHAYLPIYLVQAGICPKAFGVDVHKGPYQSAVDQVLLQGLEDRITVILGDGLKPVKPMSGAVITIAGMGGTTMREILAARPEVLAKVSRLILQPQVAGGALRLWLLQNGWALVDERLVEEENRIYEIIVAEPGIQEIPTELELELGPIILAKEDPLLRELIDRHLEGLEKVLAQLENVQSGEAQEKKQAISLRVESLRGVFA
jgi:tRNA (adenine22-N1)-methyltransferase